jgi:hypothetical protein
MPQTFLPTYPDLHHGLLGQSPFLNLVSDRVVAATLKQMGKPVGEKLTRTVAREVCLRTNSKAYIAGAIRKEGDQLPE